MHQAIMIIDKIGETSRGLAKDRDRLRPRRPVRPICGGLVGKAL